MRLPRADVVTGYPAELEHFETLLQSLADEQGTVPTRCEGWTVADVGAHVAGTLDAVVAGRFDELADPTHVQRQVEQRRGRSPKQIAGELSELHAVTAQLVAQLDDAAWTAPVPGLGIPTGEGVEALWYDTYVHTDDIRHALGRPSERGPGLRAAVAHLADLLSAEGWGPATLAFDGMEPFPVSGGDDGNRVTGDPLAFALVATGRRDPAELGLDPSVNVYR